MRKLRLFPLVQVALLGFSVALAGADLQNVRLGTDVDAEGIVPEKSQSNDFQQGSKIYITMQVSDAKQGTPVMISIFDKDTDELVWSRAQSVPGGRATMTFMIPAGSIPPGKYKTKVKLGEDVKSDDKEFKVS